METEVEHFIFKSLLGNNTYCCTSKTGLKLYQMVLKSEGCIEMLHISSLSIR